MEVESFSIDRAAEIAGCSKDTIKRRLSAGMFPGAHRAPGPGPGGPWRIPVADLDAIGMTRAPDSSQSASEDDLRVQLAEARGELRALRAHNADLRRIMLRCTCTGR